MRRDERERVGRVGRDAARARGPAAARVPCPAASCDSRRGVRPDGSNTNPVRSITAAISSWIARTPRPGNEPGQRAPHLPEAQQHDARPAPAGSRCRRRSWPAGRRRGCGAAPPPASRSSMTNEMLSSDEPCAIATMLMPGVRPARRRRGPRRRARPPCRGPPPPPSPCPRRTSTPSMSWRAISSRNSRSSAASTAPACASGTLKRERCLGRALRHQRHREPGALQRLEGARRHAGHAEHAVARHGDERLAADARDRAHRMSGVRAPVLRDLGALRRPGSAKGRTYTGIGAPAERNERARMQHLGAVVGELRRLAHVQLGNHARIGDHARIAGEEARARPSRATPTTARRARARSVAVRSDPPRPSVTRSPPGPAPMNPGTTGMMPRCSSGPTSRAHPAVGRREVGRRGAEVSVGDDELHRVDQPHAPARVGERRRQEHGAQPLAPRRDVVAGARREFPYHAQSIQQRAQLVERRLDGRQHDPPRAGRAHDLARGLDVLAPQRRERSRCRPACPRPRRGASASRRSVTPAIADATITTGPGGRSWMMATAWCIAAASASEAPPNLWTVGGRRVAVIARDDTHRPGECPCECS